ncbi:hypothetical protein [Mycolicibacterium goodii]|uniref:hypothetical protein n=1 Tax=Mycolicibacterium goodii TaxID=134601 RepID=UPI00256EA0D2|nr:hypothetical protein [Mycolicibacterium goodii]
MLGWDVSGAVEAVGYGLTLGVTLYRTGDEVFGLIGHDYLTKAPQVLKPGGILVSTLTQSIRGWPPKPPRKDSARPGCSWKLIGSA